MQWLIWSYPAIIAFETVSSPSLKTAFPLIRNGAREDGMSGWRVLSLFLSNNWRKARTFSSCCNNHGQPGC